MTSPRLGAALVGSGLLVCLALGAVGTVTRASQPSGDAPFIPTPQEVVDRMLALADVRQNDVVYDLGCGDGRIVITAAQRYGARGVGIDIDPELIVAARAKAEAAGVAHLVTFREQDLFESDVSEATVVMLYLLPALNVKLRPILTSQLSAGARIVSHNFDMETWEPDAVETFDDATGFTRNLFFWRFDGVHRP